MMWYYFLITQRRNGDSFGGNLPLLDLDYKRMDLKRAEHYADARWRTLTEQEQKGLEQFFLCEAPLDEDGCCDMDRAIVFKDYLAEE